MNRPKNDDSEVERNNERERTAGATSCSLHDVPMCYEGGIRIHGNGQCHSPSNGAVESEKLSTGTDLDESETDGPRSRSQRTWQDDVKTRSMGSQPLVSLEISRIVSTPSLSPSTQSPGYKSDSSSDTEHRSIESTEDKLAIQEKSQGKGILFVNHTSKGKTDQANPNDIVSDKPIHRLVGFVAHFSSWNRQC